MLVFAILSSSPSGLGLPHRNGGALGTLVRDNVMNPLSILTGAPLWVWPLLALLFWYGWRERNPMRVPVWTLVILPLVSILLSCMRIIGMPDQGSAIVVFGAATAIATPLGWRLGQSVATKYDPDPSIVLLSGSNFTLIFGLSIFVLNYVLGVWAAMWPEIIHDRAIGLVPIAIGGFLTGVAITRQISLLAARPDATS